MLLLLIVLLVVLIGAVVYYVLMIQGARSDRGGSGSLDSPSPRAKTEAAETLRELCGNRWSRFRMKCRGKLY